MRVGRQITPLRLLVRRSVRYLLVKRGFRIVQALLVLAALGFVLTGNRIAAIDRLGNRADIVAAVCATALTVSTLRAVNRRVMLAIDRRFFREAYDAQVILTELGQAVRNFTKSERLLELVAAKIQAALHPENVTIFLADEATGDFDAALSADGPGGAEQGTRSSLALPRDAWVIKRLRDQPPSNALELHSSDCGALTQPENSLTTSERQTLRRIQPTLIIPITSNGYLFGMISLGRRLGDLPYSQEDIQLLLVLAGQMSIVFENASLIRRMAEEERIKRELEMAADVQKRLFPASALEDRSLEIYGKCLPARWVGGDYYDYFAVDENRVAIAVADVAGKGIAAALLMSTVQALLWSQLTSEDRCLIDIVSSINRQLRRSTGEGGYATFFLAEFNKETRCLTYVNAGHNPPILFRRTAKDGVHLQRQEHLCCVVDASVHEGVTAIGAVKTVAQEPPTTLLNIGGPIIGTFLDRPYEQETIQVQSGDVLVGFTDGVTEALNPEGIEFGEQRVRSLVIPSLHLPARELAEKVIASVLDWQGEAPQHDDITLIVAKIK